MACRVSAEQELMNLSLTLARLLVLLADDMSILYFSARNLSVS
jgi:hypothetical protein